MNLLRDLLFDYTLRTVALGCLILGATAGFLGSFAVLRRQGLLGDALAHAALPGVAGAFLLTGSNAPPILMAGAVAACALAAGAIHLLTDRLRMDQGSSLAVTLSVFFGVGVLLLSLAQRSPTAAQAGLDKLLLGQAAALVVPQVVTMAAISAVAVGAALLFGKELKAACFDPVHAQAIGLPVGRLHGLLVALLTCAIIVGIQTVGVVLMAAMLVAPAAAARQWTNRLNVMLGLAASIGAAAALAGAAASASIPKAPTGPVIVLILGVIAVASVAFGRTRKRGAA